MLELFHTLTRVVSSRLAVCCVCQCPVSPVTHRPTMEGLAASTEFPTCSVVVEPPPRPPTLPTAAQYPGASPGLADPDSSDTVKLFVGQVPKTFEEKDLEPILLEFGPIHELTILRDRMNGSHKGICHTVTFITSHMMITVITL